MKRLELYAEALGRVVLTGPLFSGGEGEVFEVVGQPGFVGKVYTRPGAAHEDKLRAMVTLSPPAFTAWPLRRLLQGSTCVGYLMRKVFDAKELHEVTDPVSRPAGFDFRYRLRVAKNLAGAVEGCHRAGHVVGDISNRNCLVSSTGSVYLIDCDSFQVELGQQGKLFPCPVATPEYSPPEFHGQDLRAVRRSEWTDAFSLGVVLFQILLDGFHPFAGVFTGPGPAPPLEERIARRHWPYTPGGRTSRPPPAPPTLKCFPRTFSCYSGSALRLNAPSFGPRPRGGVWRWRPPRMNSSAAGKIRNTSTRASSAAARGVATGVRGVAQALESGSRCGSFSAAGDFGGGDRVRSREGRNGAMTDETHLSPQVRETLIRETFDAITAVGFMKWKAEEQALGNELTPEDRQLYFREFENNYFADFRKMAANAPDERLLDTREFWTEKANSMGLEECQQFIADLQSGARSRDFVVEDLGTVWKFTPLTTNARLFADEGLSLEKWQWVGPSFVVDHRAAQTLADVLELEGFTVAAAPDLGPSFEPEPEL